jgi:prephenate dehydrogenase
LDRHLGIAGYGRFGAALGDLAEEAGMSVRAHDPHGAVPAARAAAGPSGLAVHADVVVLAMPVAQTRAALELLRPHLGAGHLVLDVGSVKSAPMAAMAEVLGDAVAWAGSHPLFGPTSLALGERPLRVVLCSVAGQDAARERARSFYQRLGCEILEAAPAEHDRLMAESHGLAYFVAKGILDASLSIDAEIAPPSAQAIQRTVEAVRSDAGHLFETLQRDNPFAAAARERFMDALREAHEALARPDERAASAAAGEAAPLSIPELSVPPPELRAVRELIDELDEELVRLLARRARLARRAGQAKAAHGRELRDATRESSLLADRRRWGTEAGLEADRVEEIFRAILRFSRDLQRRPSAGNAGEPGEKPP